MCERPLPGRIAALNDAFRAGPRRGWFMTAGAAALGPAKLAEAIEKVVAFRAFDDGNDPYGEHDFGVIEVGGVRLIWKIDYHARYPHVEPADPADTAWTRRVLTLMLADEY